MGLLSGTLSVSRFRLDHLPEEPDFEAERFEEIPPSSERRESVGFVPFEPGAPYRIGAGRLAFRVRLDRRRPDPTAVRERLRDLIRVERESLDGARLAPARRRELRSLAEEELLGITSPRSRILEGVVDGRALLVGSTTEAHLGTVLELLRRIDVVADYTAPWIERGEPAWVESFVEPRGPGQSVLGCRFLRALFGDPEIAFEPESGYARLETPDATVTLNGQILADLHRYLERGAEILSARLSTGEARFKLEALSFRISGLAVDTPRHSHWIETLDARLKAVQDLFALLEQKYGELAGAGRL